MISADATDRDKARNILLKTPDSGANYVRGEWKKESNAAEIGLEYELGSTSDPFFTAGWAQKGRKGMEEVTEGLAVF